jgi:23S rRNA (guanine2445-N2)-methyltransferase / 23S rRNA (guanine2069-N7)-methyltransferase
VELLRSPEAHGLTDKYDLIFLDPPSFSNSKKMHETLDVQRDHEELIGNAMKLLYKKGKLIFSINKKGFRLSDAVQRDFTVTDITYQTIPEDFKRRPKIHQCWDIRLKD